jgi:drug/metabolite transporter (DMT)-like permease
MLFGCGFCIIILIFRLIFEPNYTTHVKSHFNQGIRPILHIIVGGFLNLAIPHSLIAIAQQWIPSAAVQLTKPLSPAVSQICSHFWIPDEPFTFRKFIALLSAVTGVTLAAVPSFLHTDSSDGTLLVAIGFVFLIISVSLFGLATVYFKLRVPNTDITVSAMVQTGSSFVFDITWSLIMDGPEKIRDCVTSANGLAWIWPLMLGVLASGVAVHGFMHLVHELGAVGANFVPFGQIIVGVTLGVAWLHEWAAYRWWEVAMSIAGVLFLIGAIVLGFWHEAAPQREKEHEEEEEAHPELTEL